MDSIMGFFEFKHGPFLKKVDYAKSSYRYLVDLLANEGWEVKGNTFSVDANTLKGQYDLMVTDKKNNPISLVDKVLKVARHSGFDTGIGSIRPNGGIYVETARPAKSLKEAMNIYDSVNYRELWNRNNQKIYVPLVEQDISVLELYGRGSKKCNFKMYLVKPDWFEYEGNSYIQLNAGNIEIYPSLDQNAEEAKNE